jgi:hypothetical protein
MPFKQRPMGFYPTWLRVISAFSIDSFPSLLINITVLPGHTWILSISSEQNFPVTTHPVITPEYREKNENKLRDFCKDPPSLLKNFLIPNGLQAERKVFYLKMKGGFIYLAEVLAGNDKKGIVDQSQQALQDFELSKREMQPMYPIRSRLALEFHVLL